jgi:hypothetical protein
VDKLTTSDKLILGGGIAYLIFMFLPWYGIEERNEFVSVSYDNKGWDYMLGGWLPLLLIVVMCAHVIITRFSPDTSLPDLPLPWAQVHLFAGVAAAVIVLLRLIIGSDDISGFDVGVDLDRQVGLFLALLAAVIVAAGGYLKSQEGDAPAPPAAGGTGSAPF